MNKEERLIKDLKDSAKKDLAFETLVNLYKEKLYYQIRRIVLNHDDTDDVLQNVFIKVYKGINKFKGDSKLSTWMYRIAYNESINFLKLKEKKYFFSSEIMMNTMINKLKEDPYFDGDETNPKILFQITTTESFLDLVKKIKNSIETISVNK